MLIGMLIEEPSSSIRDVRAKAALLVGSAELEAMRIRLTAKNESARLIDKATDEIKESNRLLLADIGKDLDRCFSRKVSEGHRRSTELRERALRRTDATGSYLFNGFGKYIADISMAAKKQVV